MDWIEISGLVAAFCTTVSFLPQAIKTIKTKETGGISLRMYATFTFGTLLWLTYGIFTKNLPVILANGITSVLAAIILFYKLKSRSVANSEAYKTVSQ
jgi:MtN3 and saliva related transmembrane protein